MLLTIDIGNTNITLGVFKSKRGIIRQGPLKVWRLNTDISKTAGKYKEEIFNILHCLSIKLSDIEAVAIASVVPSLDKVFSKICTKYLERKPFFINNRTCKELKILYNKPKDVGADRIANATAACTLYGGPIIVVDFGTATTFDCIDQKGQYIGGVIVPGPIMAAESLAERTAKLPKAKIVKAKKVIGKSTTSSIQSGLYYGYTGLIKEIISLISKEMTGRPKVIATGGLADLFTNRIKEVKAVVPELTLEGIRIIWQGSGEADLRM